MLTCVDFEHHLQDYLDGTRPASAPEVQSHLDACPACRERLALAKLCLDSWSATPNPLPSVAFTQRVLQQVKTNQRRQRWQRLVLQSTVASLVVLGVALAVWFGTRPTTSPNSVVRKPSPEMLTPWQRFLATVQAADQSTEVSRQQWESTLVGAEAMLNRAMNLVPTLEDGRWIHPHDTLEASLVPAKAVKDAVMAGVEPLTQKAQAALTQVKTWWQEAEQQKWPLPRRG
ncbi:MAG TPA: zf-HC2 domain-containing protein [Gemmatales bacterium]|nr:zf-HC2 domain-containing protein [Gemmatales bacterium]HMP60927.1 zf-HC2 domain-containing protein [Gemmatales bacterium]